MSLAQRDTFVNENYNPLSVSAIEIDNSILIYITVFYIIIMFHEAEALSTLLFFLTYFE